MSDEHHKEENEQSPANAPLHGVLAEYNSPHELIAASRKVRDAGFTRWDTFTPFPVHGIDAAMGIKMTVLPWIVLCAGLTGLATAILMQWWMNGYDYPWIISGKPIWSIPANVPIMFELTVLFSAITTLIGMLTLNRLPHPAHPLDLVRRFARVTDDKFFLLVLASDPKFDEKQTLDLLDGTHPVAIENVPEDRVTSDKFPTAIVYGLVILGLASSVPFALAAKARFSKSRDPRIHAIGDMDWQPKYKAQRENTLFADRRAQREQIEGTVAVYELHEDDHFYRGKTNGEWARTLPPQIRPTLETLNRGKERFGIYCAPCHGYVGQGDGMIAQRADALAQGTWVPPTNITQEYLKQQPVGELFNSITHGVRNMPAYGPQIRPEDRWAIILYVRALQKARTATVDDLTPAERSSLK